MKEEIINGKQYKKIKKYEHFTLYEDENGIKECFTDFDLGRIERMTIREANLRSRQ